MSVLQVYEDHVEILGRRVILEKMEHRELMRRMVKLVQQDPKDHKAL